MIKLKDIQFGDSYATIITLETIGNERYIHFLGYGYCGEDDYRFVEYTGCQANLSELKNKNFRTLEDNYSQNVNQYIQDNLTAKNLERIYNHYDNGSAPAIINESDLRTTDDGMYIVLTTR